MKARNIIILVAVIAVIVCGLAVFALNQGNGRENADNTDVSNNGTGEKQTEEQNISEKEEKYYFEYKGIKIGINDEAAPIIEKLGEPMNYFEAPSCANEGMDKVYSYSGFEFTTYTKNDKDYISSIVFLDDTVTTREGITLNSTLDDMVAAYGSDYVQSYNQYSYSDGNCVLSFIIENGAVASVEYSSVSESADNNQEG